MNKICILVLAVNFLVSNFVYSMGHKSEDMDKYITQLLDSVGGDCTAAYLKVFMYEFFDDSDKECILRRLEHEGASSDLAKNITQLLDSVGGDCTAAYLKVLMSEFDDSDKEYILRHLDNEGASSDLAKDIYQDIKDGYDNINMALIEYASKSAHIKKFKIVMKLVDDLNFLHGDHSVLHMTTFNGNLEAAQLLVDAKVNVNINTNGTTALILAVTRKQIEIIKLLLDAGADLNLKSMNDLDRGRTALAISLCNHIVPFNLDEVKILVTAGADISIADCNGKTVIVSAKENNIDKEIVEYLETELANQITQKRVYICFITWFAKLKQNNGCALKRLLRG